MKDVFSPSFKINSQVNVLTKLSQKSFINYEISSNGKKESYNVLTKAIYDIYTLNSTSASDKEKDFFKTKYNTVITVNSLCSSLSFDQEDDDCELETNLDLNKREETNLRRNDEDTDTLIKEVILPICIIEHTETNIILSLSCPETLSSSFKNDIIQAFNNIKPQSIKGFEFDKNYVDTNVKVGNDNINIYDFDNVCTEPNLDPYQTQICNYTKNIKTDKEGNLILSKIVNFTKTENSKTNKIITTNFSYEYENIPKEKSEDFNENIFKKNLDIIFPLINSILGKRHLYKKYYKLCIRFVKNRRA